MKLTSLKEIVLAGTILLGSTAIAQGAKIKRVSWSNEESCYIPNVKARHTYKVEIEKGDNLTKIARTIEKSINNELRYNKDVKWGHIYKKNKKKINDPDLIYPGQKLLYYFYQIKR